MITKTLLAFTLTSIGASPWGNVEHSGIAFDSQGYQYTVPDSGNEATVFTGNVKMRQLVKNRDWEDLDIFLCLNVAAKECLYIADMGMNTTGKRVPLVHEIALYQPRLYYTHKIPYSDYQADTEAFSLNHGIMYAIKKNNRKVLYKNINNSFEICGKLDEKAGYVTGMDMLDDMLILTYQIDKTYYIREYRLRNCVVVEKQEVDFSTDKQLEAIAYRDKNTLVAITEDGTIYTFTR